MRLILFKKIKCVLGFHDDVYLGSSLPFYQESLYKCRCCGKYQLYHNGTNYGFWTNNIKKFTEKVQEHIIKNKI